MLMRYCNKKRKEYKIKEVRAWILKERTAGLFGKIHGNKKQSLAYKA